MSAGSKTNSVAVKTLVEFAAKQGGLDRRFTPAPTGQEGIEGHRQVTSRRSAQYETEISLSIQYNDITFRGRADGYAADTHCIEEIKTFYGEVERIPVNQQALHWAQAKCYGWMYCEKNGCEFVNIAVIYFNLAEQKEYRFEERCAAADLKQFGETLANVFYQWQAKINRRKKQLFAWIEQLNFPFPSMHSSQRVMAEMIYKAAATGRVVLAEAPTGTGKTLASLFPAIKAIARTPVDKIFYLTAKTTAKQLALESIALISQQTASSPLRTLELTAQEKACLAPDKQCSGDSCPYAFDFYTKLVAAREAAYQLPLLSKQTLDELAQQFEICPFYLSMEMSRWVDIVVADVNYYFDGTPLLLALTKEFNWKSCLLVDESHNLVDRGRQMYSAALERAQLLDAKKQATPLLKKSLEKINRHWLTLLKTLSVKPGQLAVIPSLPEKLTLAITEFVNNYLELLQTNPQHPIQSGSTQDFFFAALNYQKIAEILDEDFCIDMQNVKTKQEILTLRNLIPAKQISARLGLAHCACFFSATLNPAHYYQTLLGLPDNTVRVNVPSPFSTEQLQVKIANRISTRYRDRAAAIAPMCNIIQQQLQDRPGNALVFFSSYEFLQQAECQLKTALSDFDIRLLVQSRKMNDQDRQLFINQFSEHSNLLGLAVLGGAFSEGIDLAGDSLKGVFIATLGLPQVNPVNENMRKLMQEKFQQGYDFTYTYPGIQKVIQAAGRVIRTQKDTGYLWLLDERFLQPDIQQLLPSWWGLKS